jgi:arabinan endo-1,5-alpha-L-arabinosidase
MLMLGFGLACDQQDETTAAPDEDDSVDGPRYENPVLARDFPDPSVLRASDGTYYAYATETVHDGQLVNVQVARSENLVDWTWVGDAFPDGVSWAQESRSYWAPHVVYDAEHDRYLMYYSAHHDEKDGKCLAVATAQTPKGPFVDEDEPLLCGEGFENIDPMAFDDPESGKTFLHWGSHGTPIWVQELADDGMHFKKGTDPTPVVQPDPDEPYGGLIEGAWVIYRDGFYYLFYSGDNCCGEDAHYAVMVARSESPTGPFETLAEAQGTTTSTILTENETWLAPGHNSIIQDEDGTDWVLYHAINRDQPTQPNGWDRRVLLIDSLSYEDGWPEISGGEPSAESPIPTTENG